MPLAVGSRRAKGDSTVKIVWHVSRDPLPCGHGAIDGQFRRRLFGRRNGPFQPELCDAHGFGVFPGLETSTRGPERSGKAGGILLLQFSGAALLVWLAVIFRGSDGSGFAIRWWGITGTDRMDLSFLQHAGVSWRSAKRLAAQHVVVTLLCFWRSFVAGVGLVPGNTLPNQLTIFAFGSTGVLLSLLVERYADVRPPGRFYRIALSARRCGHALAAGSSSPTASGSSPNRRYADLVFLLLCDLFPALRPCFLLSDRCAGDMPAGSRG